MRSAERAYFSVLQCATQPAEVAVLGRQWLWVCAKRLEKGRFRWPEAAGEEVKVTLSQEEFMLLLSGIDLAQTRRRPWHRITRPAE